MHCESISKSEDVIKLQVIHMLSLSLMLFYYWTIHIYRIRMQWYTHKNNFIQYAFIYFVCAVLEVCMLCFALLSKREGACVCVRFCLVFAYIRVQYNFEHECESANVQLQYSFYQPKWQQRTRHIDYVSRVRYVYIHITHKHHIVYDGYRYVVDWNQFKL